LVGTRGGGHRSAAKQVCAGGRRWLSASRLVFLLGITALVAACTASGGTGPTAQPSRSTTPPQPTRASSPAAASSAGQWALTWTGGFNKPGALSKWQYDHGGQAGAGLRQLQWYDTANATINKNSQLVITADRDSGKNRCWYGPCQFASSRMETENSFSQTYGKFEARIKFPPGEGLWPAFWLEGTNVDQVGWPACGEIDVIEPQAGKNPYLVDAYAHATRFRHQAFLTVPQPITAGFHTYGVVWNPKGITWYFDGHAYSHAKAYKGWPFDKPFFIILNLAVGGGYTGPPDKNTPFPAHLVVDWIRVYRHVGSA
jgi:beta-glucanase (GH16 family)